MWVRESIARSGPDTEGLALTKGRGPGSRATNAGVDRPAPHEVLQYAYLPDVVHIYEPHRDHGFRMWETHDLHS